jgi:hypothetical protein
MVPRTGKSPSPLRLTMPPILLSDFLFAAAPYATNFVGSSLIPPPRRAGVYRFEAQRMFIRGWHLARYRPHAVRHRCAARLALLRCPPPARGQALSPVAAWGFYHIMLVGSKR